MIKLDDRLAVIAALVRLDRRICDIGTDHALLPCWLEQHGAKDIIASDVNPNPLAAARANIERCGCTHITLIQSDGLRDIPPCDDVIIAGMGGELIADIIDGCPWDTGGDVRFILQPMTKAEHLRRYLYRSGYEIMLENGAFSGGKAYCVMLVRFTGEMRETDDRFAYFGKCTDPRYTAKVRGQLKKLANSDPSLLSLIGKDIL